MNVASTAHSVRSSGTEREIWAPFLILLYLTWVYLPPMASTVYGPVRTALWIIALTAEGCALICILFSLWGVGIFAFMVHFIASFVYGFATCIDVDNNEKI